MKIQPILLALIVLSLLLLAGCQKISPTPIDTITYAPMIGAYLPAQEHGYAKRNGCPQEAYNADGRIAFSSIGGLGVIQDVTGCIVYDDAINQLNNLCTHPVEFKYCLLQNTAEVDLIDIDHPVDAIKNFRVQFYSDELDINPAVLDLRTGQADYLNILAQDITPQNEARRFIIFEYDPTLFYKPILQDINEEQFDCFAIQEETEIHAPCEDIHSLTRELRDGMHSKIVIPARDAIDPHLVNFNIYFVKTDLKYNLISKEKYNITIE